MSARKKAAAQARNSPAKTITLTPAAFEHLERVKADWQEPTDSSAIRRLLLEQVKRIERRSRREDGDESKGFV